MQLSDETISELKSFYGGAGRHYHTWAHIEAMLMLSTRIRPMLTNPSAVELAIYYHDVIYDPHSNSNERDSIKKMQDDLSGKVHADLIQDAAVLIEATIKHKISGEISSELKSDCAYFLDLDLSILGEEEAAYDAYAQAIRQEYHFVPSPLYEKERTKILNGFLARPNLYFSDMFYREREQRARTNIEREIVQLHKRTASYAN